MEEKKVLLGVTGSVAATNSVGIAQMLRARGVQVKLIVTQVAHTNFLSEAPSFEVLSDADEFGVWRQKGDPVLHIELRKWADALLIAPLSANTLAKVANGLCDNLLTCVVRAWDLSKPMIVAPAMNTFMWTNPLTARHLADIQNIYHARVIDVVAKTLACGDVGLGAMASPSAIVQETLTILGLAE